MNINDEIIEKLQRIRLNLQQADSLIAYKIHLAHHNRPPSDQEKYTDIEYRAKAILQDLRDENLGSTGGVP